MWMGWQWDRGRRWKDQSLEGTVNLMRSERIWDSE